VSIGALHRKRDLLPSSVKS